MGLDLVTRMGFAGEKLDALTGGAGEKPTADCVICCTFLLRIFGAGENVNMADFVFGAFAGVFSGVLSACCVTFIPFGVGLFLCNRLPVSDVDGLVVSSATLYFSATSGLALLCLLLPLLPLLPPLFLRNKLPVSDTNKLPRFLRNRSDEIELELPGESTCLSGDASLVGPVLSGETLYLSADCSLYLLGKFALAC